MSLKKHLAFCLLLSTLLYPLNGHAMQPSTSAPETFELTDQEKTPLRSPRLQPFREPPAEERLCSTTKFLLYGLASLACFIVGGSVIYIVWNAIQTSGGVKDSSSSSTRKSLGFSDTLLATHTLLSTTATTLYASTQKIRTKKITTPLALTRQSQGSTPSWEEDFETTSFLTKELTVEPFTTAPEPEDKAIEVLSSVSSLFLEKEDFSNTPFFLTQDITTETEVPSHASEKETVETITSPVPLFTTRPDHIHTTQETEDNGIIQPLNTAHTTETNDAFSLAQSDDMFLSSPAPCVKDAFFTQSRLSDPKLFQNWVLERDPYHLNITRSALPFSDTAKENAYLFYEMLNVSPSLLDNEEQILNGLEGESLRNNLNSLDLAYQLLEGLADKFNMTISGRRSWPRYEASANALKERLYTYENPLVEQYLEEQCSPSSPQSFTRKKRSISLRDYFYDWLKWVNDLGVKKPLSLF